MKNRITKIITYETGAATAEYVVATMAAVGFAGLLLVILKSDQIKQVLFNLVTQALAVPGAGQ